MASAGWKTCLNGNFSGFFFCFVLLQEIGMSLKPGLNMKLQQQPLATSFPGSLILPPYERPWERGCKVSPIKNVTSHILQARQQQ